MMTPEQYFEQHPDVAVLLYLKEASALNWVMRLGEDGDPKFPKINDEIDWTGYTRRIAYNPHFQWGKRRVVEWTGKTHNFWAALSENETRRQLCNAEGEPLNIWEIGRYVDAPDVRDDRRRHLDAIDGKPELWGDKAETLEVSDVKPALSFDDALTMARGCFDYSGGHDGDDLENYHHGMQTVINVLEAAKNSGLEDTQVSAVYRVGKGGAE